VGKGHDHSHRVINTAGQRAKLIIVFGFAVNSASSCGFWSEWSSPPGWFATRCSRVTGTPTFFLNGEQLTPDTEEQFRQTPRRRRQI